MSLAVSTQSELTLDENQHGDNLLNQPKGILCLCIKLVLPSVYIWNACISFIPEQVVKAQQSSTLEEH